MYSLTLVHSAHGFIWAWPDSTMTWSLPVLYGVQTPHEQPKGHSTRHADESVFTGSTGRVRRDIQCRAWRTSASVVRPSSSDALLAPRPQRRPSLAPPAGPLTPHHAQHVSKTAETNTQSLSLFFFELVKMRYALDSPAETIATNTHRRNTN